MTTIRAAALPRAVPCGRPCVRNPETRAVFAPRPSQSAHVATLGGGCVVSANRRRGASLTAYATRVARRKYPEREPDDDDDDDTAGSSSPGEEASTKSEAPPTKPGFDADGNKLKWMEILEESAEYDPEIKTLLDGSNSDPNEVEKRIRERFEQRKERIYQEKEGSTVPLLVKFREFKSQNLWIHLESHNNISEMEQPLLDEVFKAWFVLGKLGGFNSDNMQVQANFFEVSNMEYDMDQANGDGDVPTAVFHAMGGPEYKGRWCRCWFDLGSADEMCVDVLINSLITFSREYFGLKTMVIGGENVLEDWPVQESEFYVDDAAEMDIEMGPFRPPPPGTDMGPMGGAGMSR